MSALDELKKKTYDQMDDVEKALIVLWGDVDWYEDVAAKGMDVYAALRERVAALEAVRMKAAIVIAGWEQFGFTSDYDLNVLKETLRQESK